MTLTIGSLFSGCGLFDLGLESAGLGRVVWQVESDPFRRLVLAKHWPGVDRSVTDVRRAGAAALVPVDVMAGGFPCTDVSGAGKGAGLAGERSGLWYEYLRVVEELQPAIVIVENVTSGARRWLCEVRCNLQELDYDTRAFPISAADVGAPHLRRRIVVVAYTRAVGVWQQLRRRRGQGGQDAAIAGEYGTELANPFDGDDGRRDAGHVCRERPAPASVLANADGGGWRGRTGAPEHEAGLAESADCGCWDAQLRHREAESGVGRDADGRPDRLDGHRWPAPPGPQAEHEPPRTIEGQPPNRRARLRALGDAFMPQCAYVMGRIIIDELVEAVA